MKKLQFTWRDGLISLGIMTAAFLLGLFLHRFTLFSGQIAMMLVLAVFLVSVVTDGYLCGIIASFLAVLTDNFVFTFPFFAFDFLAVDNLISAIVMLIVAIMTSTLTSKIKIQQAMKAEAEKEKMRANLLRAVSHDLRTPLTTICGVCALLQENYDSLPKAQQLKLLGQVQEDTQSLMQMVQNILTVTKVNTEGVRLHKTPTVLEELIDTTLIKFKKHYPDQTVTTGIPDTFVSIPMDAMLIQQVLLNLLENAVIHAGKPVELSLQVSLQQDRAIFRVLDNGLGIPQNRLKDLFGGFGSSSAASADGRRAGMGIGLSVCASIIHAHGGEIWGGNRENGGAQICFALEMEENSSEQQSVQDPCSGG